MMSHREFSFKKSHCLVAVAVASLFLVSCEKEVVVPRSDPALLQRAMDLQRQVYALEQEKYKLEKNAPQAESFRKQLAENITTFERAKLERDKLKEDYQSLHRDYDELIAQLEPINKLLTKYETRLRKNLEGEELGNVELRDGRVLQSVIVKKVEAEWVSLKHGGGITNIDFKMLPDYLQRKFSFRPAMVTTESLMAQEPVTHESTRPVFSPEDAAKAMHEAMTAEREQTRQKQQNGYRKEIAKLIEEVGRWKAQISRITSDKAAKRAEMNRPRSIKIAKADKAKAMAGFDFKIQQAKREVMARQARISALETMLDPKTEPQPQ